MAHFKAFCESEFEPKLDSAPKVKRHPTSSPKIERTPLCKKTPRQTPNSGTKRPTKGKTTTPNSQNKEKTLEKKVKER